MPMKTTSYWFFAGCAVVVLALTGCQGMCGNTDSGHSTPPPIGSSWVPLKDIDVKADVALLDYRGAFDPEVLSYLADDCLPSTCTFKDQLAIRERLVDLGLAPAVPTEVRQEVLAGTYAPPRTAVRAEAVPAFLITLLAGYATDKVVPWVADKAASVLLSLWPENTDFYARSVTARHTEAGFWCVPVAGGEGGEAAVPIPRLIPRFRFLRVDLRNAKTGGPLTEYGRLLYAFVFDGLHPRFVKLVPVYSYRTPQAEFPHDPKQPGFGTLIGELNVKIESRQLGANGTVTMVSVLAQNYLDRFVLEASVRDAAEAEAAKRQGSSTPNDQQAPVPTSLGLSVPRDPVADAWSGTPPPTEYLGAPDQQLLEDLGCKANEAILRDLRGTDRPRGLVGACMVSSGFTVEIQYNERTPDFVKSSKARDWYIDLVGRLKGQATDAAKSEITKLTKS